MYSIANRALLSELSPKKLRVKAAGSTSMAVVAWIRALSEWPLPLAGRFGRSAREREAEGS
jgi:hypothetical protein